MADLNSLINPADAGGAPPAQNPFASLMPNGGQLASPQASVPQAPPAPTHAQVVAGYYRLQETKRLMGKILANPKIGRENIRPLVLDAGATLIGDRLQSLAEFMKGISTFPPADDPLAQKKWVQRLYDVSSQAQQKLLQDHRAANPPDWQNGAPWSADNHSDNVSGLLAHYPS
jgi:hypothetical protein